MSVNAPETIANPQAATTESGTNGTRSSDLAARWAEARLAYPLYAALAAQFGLAPLPHPEKELPPVRPTRSVFEQDMKWLDDIDERVLAYQIRQLSPNILNSNEATLRAVIHRQLRKPDKTTIDRDKIDLLLVQYFALCAPEELYRGEISLKDVARVLQPVLLEADATPLEWCEPLETILRQPHSVPELARFDGGRACWNRAACLRIGGLHVLRSRRAGGFLPVQFSAATGLYPALARGLESREGDDPDARSKRSEDGRLPARGIFRRRNDRSIANFLRKLAAAFPEGLYRKVRSIGSSNNYWLCEPTSKKPWASGIPRVPTHRFRIAGSGAPAQNAGAGMLRLPKLDSKRTFRTPSDVARDDVSDAQPSSQSPARSFPTFDKSANPPAIFPFLPPEAPKRTMSGSNLGAID